MTHCLPLHLIGKRRTRQRVAIAWAVSLGLHAAGFCWLAGRVEIEPPKYGVETGDQTLEVVIAGDATHALGPSAAPANTPAPPAEAVAALDAPTPDEVQHPVPLPTPAPEPVAAATPVPIPAATPTPIPQVTTEPPPMLAESPAKEALPSPAAPRVASRVPNKTQAASTTAKGQRHSSNNSAPGSLSTGGGGGILMRMGAQGAPNYLRNPAPEYPRQARMAGQEGTVVLRVTVDPQGVPSEVRISTSSGFASLDDSAETTVRRKWRFKPAGQAGRPIAADVLIPVRFAIKEYRQLTLR